jgi:hypothetical protein
MQNINLVETRLLPPVQAVSGVRIASLSLVGALGVCGHWGVERAALARAMAAANGAESAEAAPAVDVETGLTELRERVAQREALRDLLATDQLPRDPAALLRAVFDALPPTLWLTEVELARERTLRISGGTLDVAALNPFAERLAAIAALRGVPIQTLRLEPAEANGDAAEAGPRSWNFVVAGKPASGGAP